MRPTKVRHLVMAMLFLLSIITYLDRVCISVAAPEMAKDIGLTDAQLGVRGGWVGGRRRGTLGRGLRVPNVYQHASDERSCCIGLRLPPEFMPRE